MLLLLSWIAIACALFLLVAPPPDAPMDDPETEALRDRLAAWAVRDAEQWQREHGDRSLPWAEAEGHLAIVIDDVGRELDSFEKLLALRHPLTFAVLPSSSYAPGVQQRLAADHRRPREILLHLPMEPLDPEQMRSDVAAGEIFLLASDTPAQLRAKLERALAAVPAAIGINNHMGSRLSADRKAMQALMPVLRERGLFLLDSRTTPETLAAEQAAAAGVPFVSRKVFLDHDPAPAAIRRALARAAEFARDEPTVAIGHPSMALVEVLREDLPRLHDQGVTVVPLSQVIAHRRTASPASL